MRRLPRALLAMLVLGTGLRIALAWAPFDPYQVEQGPLVDDSFYYFQIARNVAMGAGPTHDGVVLTSGFQPLWMLMPSSRPSLSASRSSMNLRMTSLVT